MMSRGELRESIEFLGRRTRRFFALSFVAGVFAFFVEVSFVYVLQIFLMAIGVLAPAQTGLLAGASLTTAQATGMIVGFGFLRGISMFFKVYVDFIANITFQSEKRDEILSRALTHARTYDTAQVVNLFAERLSHAGIFVYSCSRLLNTLVALGLLVVYGGVTAPREMAIGIVFLAIFVVPLRSLNRKIDEAGRGIVDENQRMTRVIVFGMKNNFLIHVYDRLATEIAAGSARVWEYARHYQNYYKIYSVKNALPVLLGTLIVAVITFIDLHFFGIGGAPLLAFIYIFVRFAQVASDANAIISDVRLYSPSFVEVRRWLTEPDPTSLVNDSESEVDGPAGALAIAGRGVNYSYGSNRAVLHDVSFQIREGQTLLIRGPSGSGKSTLISLICGFDRPTGGELKLNGVAVHRLRSWLRRRIGYVGPEAFLLPGSIRENLLYGSDRSFDDAALWAALRKAEVEDLVRGFVGGLNEILSEHAQISTGQKQRLSFARALLRDPRILILDEATSNLDEATERKLLETVRDIGRDRIVIVISHRDSFNEIADVRIDLGPASPSTR